jgi:hypothetical protein
VQPADRTLLLLRPLRHYAAGELVAVKRAPSAAASAVAPLGQAAAAAADARAAAAAAAAAASPAGGPQAGDGGAVLCYGRVAVDAAPAKGQAAYRLSVEVAPGVYDTLLSTQVGVLVCGWPCPFVAGVCAVRACVDDASCVRCAVLSTAAGVLLPERRAGQRRRATSSSSSSTSCSAAGARRRGGWRRWQLGASSRSGSRRWCCSSGCGRGRWRAGAASL